jgi:hypothetical protein
MIFFEKCLFGKMIRKSVTIFFDLTRHISRLRRMRRIQSQIFSRLPALYLYFFYIIIQL